MLSGKKMNKEIKKNIIKSNLAINENYDKSDLLGFKHIKTHYYNIIKNVELPMTIALYGAWGSGKTKMINGLIYDLDEADNSEFLTIHFDVWKYRREENLILPLLCCIEDAHMPNRSKATKSTKKLLGSAGFVVANQFFKNKIGIDIKEVEESLALVENNYMYYHKYVNSVKEMEKEYSTFIDKILRLKKKKKICIFIDNLDRCLPDTVINLLEDISSFLSIKNVPCLYVLAMDKVHVIKAIDERYKNFNGNEYLEKIVQVGLSMPKTLGIKTNSWLDFFYKRYAVATHSKTNFLFGLPFQKVNSELVKIQSLFSEHGLLNNARRIERLVNKWLVLEELQKVSIDDAINKINLYLFGILLKEHFYSIYSSIQTEKDINQLFSVLRNSTRSADNPLNKKATFQREAQNGGGVLNPNIMNSYMTDYDFYEYLRIFGALWSNLQGFTKDFQELMLVLDLVD